MNFLKIKLKHRVMFFFWGAKEGFSTRGIFGMRLILVLKCHAEAWSLRASPLNWALYP